MINLLACLAWLVASLEGPHESWLTSVGFVTPEQSVDMFAGGPVAYAAAVYWVVTTVSACCVWCVRVRVVCVCACARARAGNCAPPPPRQQPPFIKNTPLYLILGRLA